MNSLYATFGGEASVCLSVVKSKSITTRITTQRARFL
jgi:hypothetical protein